MAARRSNRWDLRLFRCVMHKQIDKRVVIAADIDTAVDTEIQIQKAKQSTRPIRVNLAVFLIERQTNQKSIASLPFCFSKFYMSTLTNLSINEQRLFYIFSFFLGFEANAIINAMAARKPIVHQSGIEISISISISPNDTKFPSSVLKSIHSRLCSVIRMPSEKLLNPELQMAESISV